MVLRSFLDVGVVPNKSINVAMITMHYRCHHPTVEKAGLQTI